MIFITHEKNAYELFIKYLTNSYSKLKNLKSKVLKERIASYAEKKGFSDAQALSRHILSLPFQEMLGEIKLFMLDYYKLSLYRNVDQWDIIKHLVINKSIWGIDLKESKEDRELRQQETIRILGIESATGDEEYTAALRLFSIFQQKYTFDVTATESNPELIKEATNHIYSEDEVAKLGGQTRVVCFDRNNDDRFCLSEYIGKLVKFRDFSIFNDNPVDFFESRFHIVLCNNLSTFYPLPIVSSIIRKVIPIIRPGGLLLVKFPDDTFPLFEGLDTLGFGNVSLYRRTRDLFGKPGDSVISRCHDSIGNHLIYIKFLLLENQLKKAREEIDSIAETNKNSAKLNHLDGDLSILEGNFKKAMDSYKRALSLNRDFLATRFNICLLDFLAGRRDDAQKSISRMLKRIEDFNCNFSLLQKVFNVKFGYFSKICHMLNDIVGSNNRQGLGSLFSKIEAYGGYKIPIDSGNIPLLIEEKKDEGKIEDTSLKSERVNHPPKKQPVHFDAPALVSFLDKFSPAELGLSSKIIKLKKELPPQQKSFEELPRNTLPQKKHDAGFDDYDTKILWDPPVVITCNRASPGAKEFTISYTPGLPKPFMDSLNKFIDEEDLNGIMRLIYSAMPDAPDTQLDILRIISRLCRVFNNKIKKIKKSQMKKVSKRKIRHLT